MIIILINLLLLISIKFTITISIRINLNHNVSKNIGDITLLQPLVLKRRTKYHINLN